MTDFQKLLDQAMATPTVNKPAVKQASPVFEMPVLDKNQAYQNAASMDSGKGANSLLEVERDLQELSPNALIAKYGADGASQLMGMQQQGSTQYQRDLTAGGIRGLGEASYDTATGVAGGFVGGIGSVAALGTGLVDDEAGLWLGNKVQQGSQWLEETQSDSLNAARRLQRSKTGLDTRDNTKEYNDSVEAGGDAFVAGLRRWGKDTVDSFANAATDPTTFAQGSSEAIGSLLAGGPIAKGLKVIGGAALKSVGMRGAAGFGPMTQGAQRVANAGEWAAWPTAIGALEAGGAYSGTGSEIMEMGHDQLTQTSEMYRDLIAQDVSQEDAKIEVAGKAAKQAAMIQGAVGFASGGLSRWAEKPFKVPSVSDAIKNVLVKEPLEEAIQGTTGTLAQNKSIQDYADDTRQLSEGVGEQTAMGALYGFSAAGTVQAPGTAIAGTKAIFRKAGESAKNFNNRLVENAQRRADEADKASPVGNEAVAAASVALNPKLTEYLGLLEAVVDASGESDEFKTNDKQFLSKVTKAVSLAPDEIASLPPKVQEILAGTIDRVTATHTLSAAMRKMEQGSPEHLEAITAYIALQGPMMDIDENNLAILKDLEPNRGGEALQAIQGLLSNARRTKARKEAMEATAELVKDEKVLITPEAVSDAVIDTPEGQAAAKTQVALLEQHPGTGSLATVEFIAKHASSGKIKLTASQQVAVSASLALLQAREKITKARGTDGLQVTDLVSGQIMTDSQDPLKRAGRVKRSAREHVNDIMRAVRTGNVTEAAALLEDLTFFANHMQNKVGALNQHFESGSPTKGVAYQALSPDEDRHMYDSAETGHFMAVHPYGKKVSKAESSITFAQTVAADADIIAGLVNGLIDAMPMLEGVEKVTPVSLDPRLQGKVSEVTAKIRANRINPSEVANTESKSKVEAPAENAEVAALKARIAELEAKESKPAVEPKKEVVKKEKPVAEEVAPTPTDTVADPAPVAEETTEEVATPEVKPTPEKPSITAKRARAEQDKQTDAERREDDERSRRNTVVVDTAKSREAMVEAFPDLVFPEHNKLLSSHRFPKEAISRLVALEHPAFMVYDALLDQDALEEATGQEANHTLTPEISEAYQTLLADGEGGALGDIVRIMQNRLGDFLGKKNKDGVSNKQLLIDFDESKGAKGSNLLRWVNGKAANIMDNDFYYNDSLLESAVLAGIQYAITMTNYIQHNEDDDYKAITGADPTLLPGNIKDRIDAGLSTDDVKMGIASKIRQYWGLVPRNDADKAYAEGISEAVAAEVMAALIETKLINIDPIYITVDMGLFVSAEDTGEFVDKQGVTKQKKDPIKEVLRFARNHKKFPDELKAFPTAIDSVALAKPENVRFIDTLVPAAATRQMNNPTVENTREQVKTLEIANKIENIINEVMFDVAQSLGVDGFKALFGGRKAHWSQIQPKHLDSLKGRESNIEAAFREVSEVVAEAKNIANKTGKTLAEVAIHYAHNFSKVGRLQQLGAYTGQGNKFTRELISPTWSTVDLIDNEQHRTAFFLALGQHLDIKDVKVHKISPTDAAKLTEAKLEKELLPIVEYLQEYLREDTKLSAEQISKLMEGTGATLNMAGLHSLVEYARYLNSDEAGKKSFRTSVYLEADGVTNGPIMAMMMMTTGRFNENWVRGVEKGGVTFGQKRAMYSLDQLDLYQQATTEMQKAREDLVNKFAAQKGKTAEALKVNMDALDSVMTTLFGGDVSFNEETGSVTFGRGISKNPLTITIYGSSPKGIANSFATRLVEAVYEAMTEIESTLEADKTATPASALGISEADYTEFSAAMQTLLDTNIATNKEGEPFVGKGDTDKKDFVSRQPFNDKGANTKFAFNKTDLFRLGQNFLYGVVNPLVEGINKTVGAGLISSTRVLRQATQVQSIFLEAAYRTALNELLESKKVDGKTVGAEFLSKDELKTIDERLSKRFPNITTRSQVFRVAKRESVDQEKYQYSRNFEDKFRTSAGHMQPKNAGVSGIASLVIGFGDAYMIQVTINDPIMGKAGYVFDGVNMALDRILEQGVAINRAALKAMLQNPMAAVETAFNGFVAAGYDLNELSEADLKALAWAFQEEGQNSLNEEEVFNALPSLIDDLSSKLKKGTASIDARHKALTDLMISIDHMATPGAPFATGPDIAQVMTTAEIVSFLNERYAFYMAGGKKWAEQPSENDSAPEIFRADALKYYTKADSITKDQQKMLSLMGDNDALKDYVFVSGSLDQILNYRAKRGLSNDNIGEMDNGFVDTVGKKIYLISNTSETLVHEMVHAATLETLIGFYSGQDFGAKTEMIKGAVERLEAMMFEFLADKTNYDNMPAELASAILDAKTSIQEHLKSNNPMSQAAALNEFMAWTTTNAQLSAMMKTKLAPKIARWAREIIDSIKELLWGQVREFKVGKDFLSNIQFNTGLIIQAKPSIQQVFESVTVFHRQSTRPELTKLRNTFKRKIVSQIDSASAINKRMKAIPNKKYLIESEEVAKKAQSAFNLSELETSTLISVLTVMGTEVVLDPKVLARVQALYSSVQGTLDVGDFMKEGADQQESDLADAKLDLILGKTDKRFDPQSRSNLLPMFLGLALVSSEFREVLARKQVPGSKERATTLNGKLENLASQLMDSMSRRMAGEGQQRTVRDAIDTMIGSLYQNMVQEQTTMQLIEDKADQISQRSNNYLRDILDKGVSYASDQAERLSLGTKSKGVRVVAGLVSDALALASETNHAKVSESWLKTIERSNLGNGFENLAKDVIGRTEETAEVYDLIKPIRAAVQQIRQQFRDTVPRIISKAFSVKPTKEQYATMFRTMAKSDIASLLDQMSMETVMDLLSGQPARNQKIQELEDALKKADPKHWAILQKKMKQYAGFMTKQTVGNNLLRNAHSISNLWGENVSSVRAAPSLAFEMQVDQLTSLYALDSLPKADKIAMASLVQKELNGVSFALSYLQGQRKAEMQKAKVGLARDNHYKGFIPSEQEDPGHLMVADDSAFGDLLQLGYVRVAAYSGSNALLGSHSRSYYYSTLPSRSSFAQGMMQNIDQTASGVDPVTGFTNGLVAGRIVSKKRVAELSNRMARDTGANENLMPIYSKGKVIAYEESVDPSQTVRLKKSEQLNDMLGVWAGRQVEEVLSQKTNAQLIDATFNAWEKDKNSVDRDLYVNLLDPKVLDAVQRDAVKLFSPEALELIQEKFGKNTFMVRKSMLEDVTGYRNASVSDFWTGVNRLDPNTNKAVREFMIGMFGNDIYKKLLKAEQILQGFVSDARTTIVVKSVVVPAANALANVYQLIARGVNPLRIAKSSPQKLAELHGYVTSKMEEIEIGAQLRAVGSDTKLETRLRARLQSIKDSHTRLSIWPLIEAGEFSTVADLGMSREDLKLSDGRFNEWIEKQVDKLPPGMQTAAKYGLVTQDTALFQGLQKSIQYSDFIAKAILYDHLLEVEMKTSKQALAQITEEFVNYDRLPGRARGGLENVGLLWFYNFKLRSIKVGLSTLRNNPGHALMMSLLPMPSGIGTPITDNLIAKGLQGSLGYTIGPGMALRAPFLNPWWNLIN